MKHRLVILNEGYAFSEYLKDKDNLDSTIRHYYDCMELAKNSNLGYWVGYLTAMYCHCLSIRFKKCNQ